MSLTSLFQERLPINRKEVYYTATVLPCIVCADGFAHIHRLWELLGIEVPPVNAAPESANIQFLTEYNAKHSIYLELDRARFPVEVVSGETPDVLILVDGPRPMIVSIEAKMYDAVTEGELLFQLRRQREMILERLEHGIPGLQMVQVALLPDGMRESMSITAERLHPVRLLTWEQIAKAFADVASASYFRQMLELALGRYGDLRNRRLVFHANMEAKMTGEEIVKAYDDGTLGFQTMGRSGGIAGTLLAADVAGNNWRRQRYELSSRETLRPNWFTVDDFVEKVRPANPSNQSA